MAGSMRSKGTNVIVWILLGLLILGLGGFGVRNFGGSVDRIGRVGDVDITVDDYARALRQELRVIEQRTGQKFTVAQAKLFGIDQQVLRRVTATAALDNEARKIGLSVGDETVLKRLAEIGSFQGPDGKFDPEAYRFTLESNGLKPAEFEDSLRRETARTILRLAVAGEVEPSPAYVDTLVAYIAERRDLTWAPVKADILVTGVPVPTEADLQAFHDENAERFRRPETREITYAWLTPEMLARTIEIPEERLREAYAQRIDEYRKPERRAVERLAFATMDEAQEARARIERGEITFDDLVAERGLTLEDVDMGEVARDDLDTEAADAVFALAEPGIAGPVETTLGPSLFRVNAILDAQERSFEEVREDLRLELAIDEARRRLAEMATRIDELLAGGATLEEVSKETGLELGTIALTPETEDGPAAYEAFRKAALAATPDDFPKIEQLEDGGIFALRVDRIVPPTVPPLDEIRDEVERAWTEEALRKRLHEVAEGIRDELAAGASFEAAGLVPDGATEVRRGDFLEGTPPELVRAAFELKEGEIGIVDGPDAVYILRVDAVRAPDPEDPDTRTLAEQIRAGVTGSIKQDLFDAYAFAVLAAEPPQIDQAAVNAVNAQLE